MSCLPCISPRKRDVSRIEDDNCTNGGTTSSSSYSVDDFLGWFFFFFLQFHCRLTRYFPVI